MPARGQAPPIISRKRSASLLFSNRAQRAILSSVIVVISGLGLRVATQPYRRSRDGRPLWIAGPPAPDSWGSLRQATYPHLLHHHPGRDPKVFRNGTVEATLSNILSECDPNAMWQHALDEKVPSVAICGAGTIANSIVEVLPGYFEGLRALDVPPPIVLLVSLQGVVGARLGISQYAIEGIAPLPDIDPLLVPEVIVDDYGSPQDYVRGLTPIFDDTWNAAGFARCTYYDAEGNWQPPH